MRAALLAGLGAAALTFAILALADGSGPSAERAAPGGQAPAGQAVAGQESGHRVFIEMGCGSCHTLAAAGSTGTFGPNLDERLPGHTRASLVARIMARPGEFEDYSGMPRNFATRMDAGELDALVGFLLAARATNPAQ